MAFSLNKLIMLQIACCLHNEEDVKGFAKESAVSLLQPNSHGSL